MNPILSNNKSKSIFLFNCYAFKKSITPTTRPAHQARDIFISHTFRYRRLYKQQKQPLFILKANDLATRPIDQIKIIKHLKKSGLTLRSISMKKYFYFGIKMFVSRWLHYWQSAKHATQRMLNIEKDLMQK